jgi:hypothetical protein
MTSFNPTDENKTRLWTRLGAICFQLGFGQVETLATWMQQHLWRTVKCLYHREMNSYTHISLRPLWLSSSRPRLTV